MTTRKELIERIQTMQLGTQEMLDAAEDDARLIPFGTFFLTVEGVAVLREKNPSDDKWCVSMSGIGEHGFYYASQLCPMLED